MGLMCPEPWKSFIDALAEAGVFDPKSDNLPDEEKKDPKRGKGLPEKLRGEDNAST